MSVEPKPQRLIDAAGGAGTAVDYPLAWVPLRWLHIFRMELDNYTGTVDFQGRFREDDSWENVPYVVRGVTEASYSHPTVEQFGFSGTTDVLMVATVEPREFLRLHVDPADDNVGTITVDVIGTDDDAALSALYQGNTGTVVIAGGTLTADQGDAGGEAWPVTLQPAVSSSASSLLANDTTGMVTAAVVKAEPGNVIKIRGVSRSDANRWFQLFNSDAEPAPTDAETVGFFCPPQSIVEYDFPVTTHFNTGIGWAWSTTPGTYTEGAAADEHEVLVEYV